ncbi:hypothetical protein, variant [Microbotryum lychnidis-dioicae p1A1 Lamole]|uniref:Uncharacterized protein n=1 Tax=Microbotryum lychnidis-dioicae (strain p1A1 Lamole / MvSl-1064) TaxID=683840 RepID=U5HF92_USTV1|nr:hypothetical protein MVLG_05772 [Microbotryum lychnidis-dioicae p1A1 Lamole]KDE03770.1 hypothetical protein, variant [Microbotryum lychnidis-dioicae p1A1 Lamole]|eukprot:KDE03769.1 hypothetical protein MVLG_05772 [Microbotryum lychnidis-dioicae p1A1 Lamole]
MTSQSSNEHESLGHRIISAMTGHRHHQTKLPSEIASQKRSAKAEHDRLEAQVDAEIQDRERREARAGVRPFQAPEVVGGRLGLEEIVQQAHHPEQHSNHHQGHPDLYGGTHIPETSLPQMHHETQHTALRPSDPNDPTAMDGAVRNDTSAGDDYAI